MLPCTSAIGRISRSWSMTGCGRSLPTPSERLTLCGRQRGLGTAIDLMPKIVNRLTDQPTAI